MYTWLWGGASQELDGVGEVGRNGGWDGFVAVNDFVAVIGTPHSDTLLTGFVGLQQEEARLLTIFKNLHYYSTSM